MKPLGILIHRSESGLTGDDVDAHESRQKCGYHFFIRKDGTVDSMHPVDGPVVWHARSWSRACIGIAVYGDFDPREHSKNSEPTTEQLMALSKLCLSLWKEYGPLPIYGHTDLPEATRYPDKSCPGSNLDVQALAKWVFIVHYRDVESNPPRGPGTASDKSAS